MQILSIDFVCDLGLECKVGLSLRTCVSNITCGGHALFSHGIDPKDDPKGEHA